MLVFGKRASESLEKAKQVRFCAFSSSLALEVREEPISFIFKPLIERGLYWSP